MGKIQIYLNEIKIRLVLSALCFVNILAALSLKKEIVLIYFFSLSGLGVENALNAPNKLFLVNQVTEVFSAYFRVLFLIALKFSLISFCYHAFMFFGEGLRNVEKSTLLTWAQRAAFAAFVATPIFNMVVFPLSFRFFLYYFEGSAVLSPFTVFQLSLANYFEFYEATYVTFIYYLFGSLFLIACAGVMGRRGYGFSVIFLSAGAAPDGLLLILSLASFFFMHEYLACRAAFKAAYSRKG